MSHSQFHCTARVYLDMHGLSFETSICYWQDQPGSRHPRRTRGRPARRRALPTLTAPALAPLRPAGGGITDATVAAWQRRHRRRRTANQAPGAGPAARHPQRGGASPAPAAGPFPRRRGRGAGTAKQLFAGARAAAPRSRRLPAGGETHGGNNARAPGRLLRAASGRPGLTRPRGRPGCGSRAIAAGGHTHKETKTGAGKTTELAPPPTAAGAPDVLEETATRRGGRDPATEAPCRGGSLCSKAEGRHGKPNAAPAAAAEGDAPLAARGTPPGPPGRARPQHTRSLPRFARSFAARPPRRPALLAAGTHGHPDRGQHRRLAWFRTPGGSRGHAAVTQPGSVKKPEEPRRAAAGRGDAGEGARPAAIVTARFARGWGQH